MRVCVCASPMSAPVYDPELLHHYGLWREAIGARTHTHDEGTVASLAAFSAWDDQTQEMLDASGLERCCLAARHSHAQPLGRGGCD